MKIIETVKKFITDWWTNFTMSSEERWLGSSRDVCELENRLKNLEYKNSKFTV